MPKIRITFEGGRFDGARQEIENPHGDGVPTEVGVPFRDGGSTVVAVYKYYGTCKHETHHYRFAGYET